MSSVLSRIQIILEASTANYNNELRRARENSSTTFAEIGNSASKMALVAGTALAGMGALSIKSAMSFESAMAEIDKTVDFASSNGLANMRKELQALTTQIPQTFEELAAVTATGGQLGIAEKDLVRFTEVMAKMGVAFDIPAQQAADSMAKIANVFQIPIANIDRLGDAINTLSNNTPATAAQLIDSLQRVGGVAKVFGLSEDATLGLTGALIAMGKPAEVASTAVNSLLTSFSTLDNATKSQLIGFEQLGINIDDFSKLVATDGKQAIITYLEAINQLEQSKRIGTNALIIGKEFGDDITMLAGSVSVLENNWAMLGETVNTTKDYFGSMDVEFEKISATSANKMVLFKNNIDGVVASVGDAFIPALNDLLLNMTPMVATVGTWVAANPELIQQITLIGGSLLGTIVGLKLAVDGFTAAKTTIDGLKLAYAALGTTLGLTVLGLGILLAAGVLVYQNWDKIKQVVNDNQPVFIGLGVSVTALTVALIAANAPLILLKVQTAAAAVQAGIMTVATAGWSVAAGVAAAATWTFNAALAVLTSPIFAVVAAIALIAAGGYLVVKNWSAISAGLKAEWDKISSFATSIWSSITSYIGGRATAAGQALSNAWNSARSATVTAFNNIKTTITTALSNLPSQMLTIGRQIIQGLINGIKGGASGVASAIGNVASSAIAKAKSVLDINSPSRVMRTVGEQTAEGMAVGIKKGKKAVVTEAQKMAADAIKATKDGIAGMQRELALFGNTSKVAEYQYDISTGKFSGNTGQLLDLAKQLELRKTESSVISDIVSMQREMHNLTTPYTNELSKIKYELESIEGKYKNVNELQKELLLEAADELDAYRLASTARGAMLDIARQMALLDDSSMFAALSYDLNDVNNQISELSDTIKNNWLEAAANLDRAKESKAINDSLVKSYESLHKEITLFGNSGAMAELNYELQHTTKYAGASEEALNKYADAITKLAAVKADKAFSDLLSDNEGINESPAGKIMKEYQDKLDVIAEYERLHTELLQESADARNEVERAANRAKYDMYVDTGELIFGTLSDASKSMLGEQSKVHRALFIAEKAFSIARAVMNIQVAMSSAAASLPFPANLGAIATVATNVAGIVSTIASLKPPAIQGQAHNGLDYVPREGTYLLDKGERVVKPRDNRKLSDFLDNTDGYQSKAAPVVNMTIENHAGVPVSHRVDDDGRIRVIVGEELNKQLPMQINDPSSPTRRALTSNFILQRNL